MIALLLIMLPNPWIILGSLAAVAVLTGVAYYQGRQDGAAAVRSEQAEALARERQRAQEADARYRDASAALAAAETRIGDLLAYRPDPHTLVREIVREVPVDAQCTCPDRSPEYRLQYNAIAAGDIPETASDLVPATAQDH
jgi:hypothetical protein